MRTASSARSLVLLGTTALVACCAGLVVSTGGARENGRPAERAAKAAQSPSDTYLLQSPGGAAERDPNEHLLGPGHASKLKPYPPGGPGDRTPLDLWRYA